MIVKFLPHMGCLLQGSDGTDDLSGYELVLMSIAPPEDKPRVKLDRLARIVGRLIDKLPEHERIEACCLESQLERPILFDKRRKK